MIRMRCSDGAEVPLAIGRWLGRPTAEDFAVLALAVPPVLDVGCGPGRHVLALAERGMAALGVDPAPTAVRMGRSRGAIILQRSVFDRIPGAGRWGTALLLDGNVGIGGHPDRLLHRLAGLVATDGRILVEAEPPGFGLRMVRARIEALGRSGPWFPWARVGVHALTQLSGRHGFVVDRTWRESERWFVALSKT
jgi:SAM-dependent methyltransferase